MYTGSYLKLCIIVNGKKIQVVNDQEKAQSEKKSHSKNRSGKTHLNLQLHVRTYTKKTYRKPSEQLLSNSLSLSYPSFVATISVHQRLLFTMDNSRCGRNDLCPLAKWTIVVEHVDIKIIFNDYCSFSLSTAKNADYC